MVYSGNCRSIPRWEARISDFSVHGLSFQCKMTIIFTHFKIETFTELKMFANTTMKQYTVHALFLHDSI